MIDLKFEWGTYMAECLPGDCPEIQVIETRKAFSGGLIVMWQFLHQLHDVDVDMAQKMVADMQLQLRQFHEEAIQANVEYERKGEIEH